MLNRSRRGSPRRCTEPVEADEEAEEEPEAEAEEPAEEAEEEEDEPRDIGTCGGCGRSVEFDTGSLDVCCTYWNKKVFYKERPTVAKQMTIR